MKNVFIPAAIKASLLFLTAISSAQASLSVWDINNVADITGAFTISGNTVTAYNGNIVFQDNNAATNAGFTVTGGVITPTKAISFSQGTITTQGNGEVITFTATSNDAGKIQTDSLKLYFNGNINNLGLGPITLTDASLTETDPSVNNRNNSSTPTASIDLLMTAFNQGERCDTKILSNITDPVTVPEPSSIALLALGFLGAFARRNKSVTAITA